MQRVMILGQGGSGKSTLARALGACTEIPVFHIDQIHWLAGWKPRDRDERIEMVRAIHACDQWILEGALSSTYDERADRADVLIILDVGLALRLWRVTARFVRFYGKTRPDMADGCPEGNWRELISFYRYMWATRKVAKETYYRLADEYQHGLDVVVLRSIEETEEYLDGVRREFG